MTDHTNHEPNDDLNPAHELASAYLDGVASPAERAEVNASAELSALVASFTAIRAQLADIPPVATVTRDAAFAAAFAEFDAPALAPAASAAIIPLSSKRRWARPVLSVAAAVLLVGAIGVAAKSGFSGDDSDSSSATLDSSAKVAAADASTQAEMSSNSLAMAPVSTIGSIGGGAQAALIIDTPEQLRDLAMTPLADTVLPIASSPDTTAAAAETTVSESTAAPADVEAASYARSALACLAAQQVFLADIVYQGVYAIAARDTVTGMTSAIADDCTVLVTVEP